MFEEGVVSLLFFIKKYKVMELGIQWSKGFLLGFKLFDPTELMPYKEVQLYVGPICVYVIWD